MNGRLLARWVAAQTQKSLGVPSLSSPSHSSTLSSRRLGFRGHQTKSQSHSHSHSHSPSHHRQRPTPPVKSSSSSSTSSSTSRSSPTKAQPLSSLTSPTTIATTNPSSNSTASTATQSISRDWWKALSSTGRDDVALSRYPNLRSAGGLLRGADYAGTVTFALTGTITAAQSGLDVFGSTLVGILTSVGGGTIRDAILLHKQPFWTEETEYIWMGIVTGLITFFVWPTSVLEWQQKKQEQQQTQQSTAPATTTTTTTATTTTTQGDRDTKLAESSSSVSMSSPETPGHVATANSTASSSSYYDSIDGLLDALDAIGLSAFAIIGAQNGLRANMPLLVCAICGMATATFGGVVRDVLCGRPVRIVHSTTEVYAPPALMGATVYAHLAHPRGLASAAAAANPMLVVSPAAKIGLAMATCMGSRYVAIQNDVKLHTWDTSDDNLGVTIRKKPTKHNYAHKDE